MNEKNKTPEVSEHSPNCPAPAGSPIQWVKQDEETLKGYVVGHPETTLFLITALPMGDVKLCGAFIPNGEENEIWDLKNAKAAAEGYMMEWLLTVGVPLLSENTD